MKLAFSILIVLLMAIMPTLADAPQYGSATLNNLIVEQAFIKKPYGNRSQTTAYAIIRNTGDEDDNLIALHTPAAAKTEIHSMILEGEVMKMRPLGHALALPAGQTVEIKPNDHSNEGGHSHGHAHGHTHSHSNEGLHFMLIRLNTKLEHGDIIELTLVFEKAGMLTINVPVTARKH